MELTDKGKELGRGFRKQAEHSLGRLKMAIARGTYADDTAHNARMTTLSLLAAVLAYIDPEYKPE